jgi:peptide/nickel transport system substrate-binding protein
MTVNASLSRRAFIAGLPIGVATLASPPSGHAEPVTTLTFVPVADLTVLDPFFALPDVTAQHANLIYDTLWGMHDSFTPQLQMLEKATTDEDGRRWTLTLRDGLTFHDGTPVRAEDVVASIRVWATRDVLGMRLISLTDTLDAVSDKVVVFRLKQAFPLLPTALSKPAAFAAYVLPRRIAESAGGGKAIEPIGSGPYRYVTAERLVGSRVVYARFEQYKPRPEPISFFAGGKIAGFDRIVWNIIPDPSTAAASLQKGETDWVSDVSPDIAPLLRRSPDLTVQVQDFIGGDLIMRFNALWPPFDNPAIRAAVLPAINQADFMTAIAGDDRSLWRDHVGVFSTGKPMSTDAGVEVMAGDVPTARKLLQAAGYRGERVAVMSPSDYPSLAAAADVGADLLKRIGFNVDLEAYDYGTMMQRRENRSKPAEGGWNVFFAWFGGYNRYTPAAHLGLSSAFPGWPKIDEIEALRDKWVDATDVAAQQEIARRIQLLVWRDVPFIPLGEYFPLTAFRKGLSGVQKGLPQFFNVSRTG